ncbi:hypothetical protein DC31_10780 [Microbacterium sp. CH12i]|uniref:hypothetical protein n=1 Tax=Microbacterium sp. CH12i TaxID=1479651 RepID=UPI0004619C25|nr:hypothetical protein [Microbacterium sp. CH12i]KDA06319.1 hypothetical protein DC31_10780 [Microbacterium sp. CH12i]
MRPPRLRVAAVLVALVVATPLMVNAAPSPRYTGFCDSFLSFLCPKPAPTPGSSTAPAAPVVPSAPGETLTEPDAVVPVAPDSTVPPTAEAPVPAPVDDGAPIFTGTPAAMGAGGLSFTGLKGISIVSVPTIDGSTVRALKISAESVTITDFSLSVRPPDGPGLVTNADTMSLQGNVSVYLGSATATALGGAPLTLGLDTPPSLDEIEPGLLNVSFGLVGSIADSISYTNTDQRIVE